MRAPKNLLKTLTVVALLAGSAAIAYTTSNGSVTSFVARAGLALCVFGVLIVVGVLVAAALAARSDDPNRLPWEHRMHGALTKQLPQRLARWVVAGLATARAVWFVACPALRRSHYAPAGLRYAKHLSLFCALALGAVVVAVVTLLVALPGGPARITVSIVGGFVALCCVGFLASLLACGHEMTDQYVRVRMASFTDVVIHHSGVAYNIHDEQADSKGLHFTDHDTLVAPIRQRTNLVLNFAQPAEVVASFAPNLTGTTVTELKLWIDSPKETMVQFDA